MAVLRLVIAAASAGIVISHAPIAPVVRKVRAHVVASVETVATLCSRVMTAFTTVLLAGGMGLKGL